MLRICSPPHEVGELPPMGEFRNIDKTMIKTEFTGEQGGGRYEKGITKIFDRFLEGYENMYLKFHLWKFQGRSLIQNMY